jgi:anti-sigma regulatory factor (Ser/Thr protein kinase)
MDLQDPDSLHIEMHPSYVNLHPAALAALAALGRDVNLAGGRLTGKFEVNASLNYMQRMGLFEFMGMGIPFGVTEHDSTGRFVPLTAVTNGTELGALKNQLAPMLHPDDPSHVAPATYVLSELLRNVIEHSRSPHGAVVCAQYYRRSGVVGIGVADTGIGLRQSLELSHDVPDDERALSLALSPGVTGTSTRPGGSESNAGAGLFFTKAIARAGRSRMVLYSGDSMYKLNEGSASAPIEINSDPLKDPHRIHSGLPAWPGTVVGIDIALSGSDDFRRLFLDVREFFDTDTKFQRRAYYRKPRFR